MNERSESIFEFACPECEGTVVVNIDNPQRKMECPLCYAIVTVPNSANEPDQKSRIVVDSLREYDYTRSPGEKLSNIFLLWLISAVLRFGFPIPALLIGIVLVGSIFITYPNDPPVAGKLLQGIPLIIGSFHSFFTGLAVWRLRRDVYRKMNVFVAASLVYSLLFWIGAGISYDHELELGLIISIIFVGWLMIFVPPIMFLFFYFRFSKRTRSLIKSGK